MLQITPHHRFFLGIEPLDFRKGIDAIAAYCKQRLQADPMSGAIEQQSFCNFSLTSNFTG